MGDQPSTIERVYWSAWILSLICAVSFDMTGTTRTDVGYAGLLSSCEVSCKAPIGVHSISNKEP